IARIAEPQTRDTGAGAELFRQREHLRRGRSAILVRAPVRVAPQLETMAEQRGTQAGRSFGGARESLVGEGGPVAGGVAPQREVDTGWRERAALARVRLELAEQGVAAQRPPVVPPRRGRCVRAVRLLERAA